MNRNLKLVILIYYIIFFSSAGYVYNYRSNIETNYFPVKYSEHEFSGPTNFAGPSNFAINGDGYLVSTITGLIYSVTSSGQSVILDLTDEVYNIDDFSEDGLFSVELHPNFESNGYLYVFYTRLNASRAMSCENRSGGISDTCLDSRISRFTAVNNQIDKASELVVMNIPLFGPWHRSGGLEFDSKGMLLASIGDDWTFIQAQNLSRIYGKIIRIDVDNAVNGNNYSIPEDNPFKNNSSEGILPEIWAYGVRNSYRIRFSDGILFAGDVGHDTFEEINIIEPGKNYGWPIYEGIERFVGFQYSPQYENFSMGDFEEPFYVYSHSRSYPIIEDEPWGFATLSGHIYKGDNYPELKNKFILGDWIGTTWVLTLDNNNGVKDTKFLFKLDDELMDVSIDQNGEIVFSGRNTHTLYTIGKEQVIIFIPPFIIYGSILLILPLAIILIKKYVFNKFKLKSQ